MAYEQVVNFTTTNTQGLQQGVTLTDKLAASTKTVSDLLYGEGTATEKLTLKVADLAVQESKLEALRERHRIQQDSLTAATNRHADAQVKLGQAASHTVTGVQAASGALRELEGNIPIRAAEQFLVKMLGFGPALQAIFPLVGAIAFLDIIDKGAEKLGIHLNLWHDINEAQKRSNKLLDESSKKYEELVKQSRQISVEEARIKQGPEAAARLQASFGLAAAGRSQADTVGLQEQLSALETIVNARQLRLQQPLFGGAGSTPADAISPLTAFYAKQAGINGITPGQTPSLLQEQAATKAIPGISAALQVARQQQENQAKEAQNQIAQADKDRAKQDAEEAKTAAREAAAEATKRRLAEARNAGVERSATEAYARAFFGNEAGPQRNLSVANQRIEDQRSKALAEVGADPTRVNKAFDLEKTAAFIKFLDESSASLRKFNEEVEQGVVIGQKIAEEQGKALEKAARTGIDVGITAEAPAPPPGYISPQQQLRSARDTGRRNLALYGAQSRLAGVDEGTQAQGLYQLRAAAAEAEYKADLRIADQKHDLVAASDALAKKEQELFDARLEHEQALLQIALQQKEAFQNSAVGLFNAAKSGNVGGFLKSELNKLEDTVVGNAAGMAWKSVAGIIPHAGAGSVLGNLLQGTAFGPDPVKEATVQNTLATQDNTAALQALALSPSSGGGSAGGFGGVGGASGPGSPISAALRKFGITNFSGGEGPNSNTPTFDPTTGGEIYPGNTTSKGSSLSAGKAIGYGAAAATAAFGAYSGFKAGGAQGALEGTGAILGAASLIPGPQQPFVMAAAMATTLVAGILGDPKVRRANEIQAELKYNQYMAPVAINASMTTGGTFADYDRFGQTRGSGLSPFPTIEQGFFDYLHDTVVPGRTDSQFGGRGGGAPIIVQVQTLDSRSFNDNSHLVADAVVHALDTGRATSLQERLRNS